MIIQFDRYLSEPDNANSITHRDPLKNSRLSLDCGEEMNNSLKENCVILLLRNESINFSARGPAVQRTHISTPPPDIDVFLRVAVKAVQERL